MPSNFPSGLDSLVTNRTNTTVTVNNHPSDHNDANDAINQIEKVLVGPVFYNVKGYGAVGDGVTNDAAAIQAAIDAVEAAGGGVVFFPRGTYLCLAGLTIDAPNVYLVGSGRVVTLIRFDVGTLVDGVSFINPGAAGTYLSGGGIINLAIRGLADFTSVRDVVLLDDPQKFILSGLEVRGGARYGVHARGTIDTTLERCTIRTCRTAGLYIPPRATATSTTIRVRDCYLHLITNGPGADIDCLGATFDSTVFESNGELDSTLGVGVQVRGGEASFNDCYWENNAGHDLLAGTEAATYITMTNHKSAVGPYSAAAKAHVYLDQFVSSGVFVGGRMNTRPESFIIHPSVRGVFAAGIRMTGNETPLMTDASDPKAQPFGIIFGVDTVTGRSAVYGRWDANVRHLTLTGQAEAADGTSALPGYAFSGDTDSGLYRIGANNIGVTVGGNPAINIGSGGTVTRLLTYHLRLTASTTAARPSAATVGNGVVIYDTTLSKPVFSDGTNWRDAAGTVV